MSEHNAANNRDFKPYRVQLESPYGQILYDMQEFGGQKRLANGEWGTVVSTTSDGGLVVKFDHARRELIVPSHWIHEHIEVSK